MGNWDARMEQLKTEPESNRSSVEELVNLYCISYWEYFFLRSPTMQTAAFCALPVWQWPSCRQQVLCCTVCVRIPWHCLHHCVSIRISLIFYVCWLLSYLGSICYHFSEPVLVSGSDFFLESHCWSGFLCEGCGLFCRWPLLQVTSGQRVFRDVVAPKGVQIKYTGVCGLKAMCIHTLWNLILFSSHFAFPCTGVLSICLLAFALPSLLIFLGAP